MLIPIEYPIMVDGEKQIDYWRRGSTADGEVAMRLVKDGKRWRSSGRA